jgi:hypothetical protein
MPLSPPLVLEARSGTKFQLFPIFNIVGPFLGLTRNLGRVIDTPLEVDVPMGLGMVFVNTNDCGRCIWY